MIGYSSYKMNNIIGRVILSTILGYLAIFLCNYLISVNGYLREYHFGVEDIIGFNLITEGFIFIDFLFERRMSGNFKAISKRIALEGIVAFLWAALVYFTFYIAISDYNKGSNIERNMFILTTAIFVLVWSLMFLYMLFVRVMGKWFDSMKYIETLKQQKMERDYMILQDQLNPHFLFNNLSVLKSLVILHKEDSAIDFIQNFSDVYRYVLACKDKITVSIEEEVSFTNKYAMIYKERIGSGININIDVNKEYYVCEIAPLSLQLLVENAIKHNIAEQDNMLNVTIKIEDDYIVVSNNMNPKQTTYSTKVGLSNLIGRYEILTNKKVSVTKDDGMFIVKIPLL